MLDYGMIEELFGAGRRQDNDRDKSKSLPTPPSCGGKVVSGFELLDPPSRR
jgi:hypothetical protein